MQIRRAAPTLGPVFLFLATWLALGVETRSQSTPVTQRPIFTDLIAELQVQTDRLHEVVVGDVAAFNAEAKRLGLAPINIQAGITESGR